MSTETDKQGKAPEQTAQQEQHVRRETRCMTKVAHSQWEVFVTLISIPSRCILQYGKSIWIAIHVVVSNVQGYWNGYFSWPRFRHKWHKAPDCALVTEIL